MDRTDIDKIWFAVGVFISHCLNDIPVSRLKIRRHAVINHCDLVRINIIELADLVLRKF